MCARTRANSMSNESGALYSMHNDANWIGMFSFLSLFQCVFVDLFGLLKGVHMVINRHMCNKLLCGRENTIQYTRSN